MSPRARAQKWGITLSVVTLVIAGALILRGAEPRADSRWMPKCAFNHWTGLHCPSCGNTRATHALLHGNLPGAIEQNVAFVIALPFLLLGATRAWLKWVYPEKWKPLPFTWHRGYSLVLIGCVVIFMILRNLPMRPWSWLAPIPLEQTTAEGLEEPDQDSLPQVKQ